MGMIRQTHFQDLSTIPIKLVTLQLNRRLNEGIITDSWWDNGAIAISSAIVTSSIEINSRAV
jgi:hypothetical protein